jgi:hypothetical protein
MPRTTASLLLAVAAAAAPQSAPAPVHLDAPAVEKGMLDATKGLMYGDFKGARAALDTVEANCRRLGYDDTPAWPRPMVDQDVGMHGALSRAREYTSREMWEEATNSLIWVQRSCRDCHALRTTTASPSGSGSPIPPTGSTP